MTNNEKRLLCPLCGEQKILKIRCYYNGEQKLFKCFSCGMIFSVSLFDERRPVQYEKFYQEYSLEEQVEIQHKEHEWNSRWHTYYDYIITRIVAKHGIDIVLLDIGCGPGNFLDRVAAYGIRQRVGIDPQKPVIAFNRERGLHHCIEGYYSREKFAPQSFDIIYHNHVLEHIANPIIFLKDNYYHLISGGTLVVSVPSVRSPEFLVQVLSNNRLCRTGPLNPQHLVYFGPTTLVRSLQQAGFVKIHIQTGLWVYKRPKLRWLWRISVDKLFNFLKIGTILVFAEKSA